jgi:hypothetical protein
MPSGESDLRAMERLLRETTPLAAVTVDFRQRVVQASLDVRLRQLSRRQALRSACFALLATCVLLMPVGLLATALLSSMQAGVVAVEFPATHLTDIGFSTRGADGNDVLPIQQQLEARVQNWVAAQRAKP